MPPLPRSERSPFTTKDGSQVRELVHPRTDAAGKLSLAEAVVPPGGATLEHHHRRSEEIYHFTAGRGRMRLGPDEFAVAAGDSVVIPPGVPHKLWAAGAEPLVLLCCCSPPYADEDTILSEEH
jgi:mannose-6-phosphate isomerase-like protein (cupin superfamily)